MTDEQASARLAGSRTDRPDIPAGYGVASEPEGMLPWAWAEERLAEARNYWIITAAPDGRPHAMPVWGVWLDGTFYFATGRTSRKARNLLVNPRLVVHLESGDDVVILEGVARETADATELAAADVVYGRKYTNPETGEGFSIAWDAGGENAVFALRPEKALAWQERSFPNTATRWRFAADRSA